MVVPAYDSLMNTTDSICADENLVRDAAYFLWLNHGCPCGRDLEFWNLAKQELAEARKAPTSVSSELMEPAAMTALNARAVVGKNGATRVKRRKAAASDI